MPSETKFTPGPWSADFPAPWRLGHGCYSIVDAHGKTLCEIFGRDPGPAEDLIIAAPDLYEALEELVAPAVSNSLMDMALEFKPRFDKALATLAKARGEQPQVQDVPLEDSTRIETLSPEDNEINTNEPPTIADVRRFLSSFPESHRVRAYEGEGGSWIIVEGDSDAL